MNALLATERFWVDKSRCESAERQYYELLAKQDLRSYQVCVEKNFEKIQQGKPKKIKKPKGKRNGATQKLTETSTNSDSEDRFMLPGCHVKVPVDNANPNCNNEKIKKRNKAWKKNGQTVGTATNSQCTLVSEIAKAREHIKNSLEKMDGITGSPASGELLDRIVSVERDNADLRKLVEGLKSLCNESVNRITVLENQMKAAPKPASAPIEKSKDKEDDDDGVDLFASDSEEESEETARIREERLAAYAAKKSKKPVLIAKSSLVLDVKPWDDETDMKAMETEIRKISADGLLWGASKFVPVAYGIQKLSISCVVEDDKISIDWLTEEIEKCEDFVQSVDVAAFNKI